MPSAVLMALITGAAVLVLAAVVGIRGLLTRPATLGRRLGWLFWPMLALDAFITELAYLRLLPASVLFASPLDKAAHLVLFGALVFFLDLWLRGRDLRLARLRLPLALLLALAGASIEESLQSLSPARSADLLDLLSDLVGMVLATGLSRRILRRERAG